MQRKFYTETYYCRRSCVGQCLAELRLEHGQRRFSVAYGPTLDHARIGKNFAIAFVLVKSPIEAKVVLNVGEIVG